MLSQQKMKNSLERQKRRVEIEDSVTMVVERHRFQKDIVKTQLKEDLVKSRKEQNYELENKRNNKSCISEERKMKQEQRRAREAER